MGVPAACVSVCLGSRSVLHSQGILGIRGLFVNIGGSNILFYCCFISLHCSQMAG